MGYIGPEIAPGSWSMQLEPLPEAWRDEYGNWPWLGTVFFADSRRAMVVILVSEQEVETLELDPGPLEWLIAQTTPSRR